MSEDELDKKLINNWDYLSSNEKNLLLKLGISPETILQKKQSFICLLYQLNYAASLLAVCSMIK